MISMRIILFCRKRNRFHSRCLAPISINSGKLPYLNPIVSSPKKKSPSFFTHCKIIQAVLFDGSDKKVGGFDSRCQVVIAVADAVSVEAI